MLAVSAIAFTSTIGESRACVEKTGMEFDIGQEAVVVMEQGTVFVLNNYKGYAFEDVTVETTYVDYCGCNDVMPLVYNLLIADDDVGWQGKGHSTIAYGLTDLSLFTDSDTDLSFRKARDGLTC